MMRTRRAPTAYTRITKELQALPSVGPSIADDLYALGVRSIDGLATMDPERLYTRHCRQKKMIVDRCVLYTFRCAVYAARTGRPKPELLLWWNWKDRILPRRRTGHHTGRIGSRHDPSHTDPR